MNQKIKYILILLTFIGIGVAVGRYTIPAKIVTKTETKEVIKWKEKVVYKKQQQKKNDKEVIVVETVYPNGKKVKKTHIVDKGTITVDLSKEISKDLETQKSSSTEITKEFNNKDWFVSGLIKNDLKYGISVNRRIIGPFYIGGFGFTDKMFGGSIGVSF